MKIQIENLKAQMTGRELNIHQKADALIEFNKLLDYVDELEQLTIPDVSQRSELLIAFNNELAKHQDSIPSELKVKWNELFESYYL